MKERETPLRLVRLWPKMLPNCYEMLDYLMGAKADGQEFWPDWCQLPINAAFTYLVGTGLSEQDASMVAAELTACWMWRQNKIVYQHAA